MKKAEAFKLIEAGELIVIGEYRSSDAQSITYRDKTTGRMAEMDTLGHTVEFGNHSIKLRERTEDNFKPDQYKAPYKKGQKVVVQLESLLREKGVYTGSGKLQPLED